MSLIKKIDLKVAVGMVAIVAIVAVAGALGVGDLLSSESAYGYSAASSTTTTTTETTTEETTTEETTTEETTTEETTTEETTTATEEVTPVAGVSFGDLIKGSGASVYYYAHDGKRYVFPDEKTFMTWYTNFSSVKTISDSQLSSITIGGNVTYKPGVRMVKITTDPKVYAVDKGGVLRWVKSEAVATALYGSSWNQLINDVSDPFFVNYTLGEVIDSSADYSPAALKSSIISISQNKGLQ